MFICLTLKKKALIRAAAILAAVLIGAVCLGALGGSDAALCEGGEAVPVPILMYHSILKDPASACAYVVSPELFRSDMEYLRDNGYTTVFVSDLVDYAYSGARLPEKPVVVTFDDGFLNNLTYILPILEEMDLKAVVSVVGKYSESYSDTPDANPAYAYLTWDDIITLRESGHVEIGSHTYDMHTLGSRRGCAKRSGESEDDYRAALEADLTALQELLSEHSGVTPTVFAYPFGLVSGEALEVIKDMGFKAALTCSEKVNYLTGDPEELFYLGRFNRPAGISTQEFMKRILSE